MKTERQQRQFEFYMSLASLRGSCAVALHGTLVSDEAKGLIRNVLWAAELDLRKNYREYQQSYGSKDLVDLLPEEPGQGEGFAHEASRGAKQCLPKK